MESWVQRWRPRTNALCDFSTPPVESTAPATKNRCQVIRSAAPVTQNHLRKSTYLMLQNATPLRKSAPWPPNISDEHVSCTAPARPGEMHLCRSSSNVPRLPLFLEMLQNPHVLLTFDTVHNPLRLPRETRSERPKVVRTPSAFNILTWKCASRHSGVHFFDISTSKSRPKLVCFVHVHFKMCFAPQRRAILRHLNFQKWSERGVFCTFWLGNVLRATTACTFSTSQVPKVVVHFDLEICFAPQRRALFQHLNFQKVVRTWCVLYILAWKCASRHNDVHLFDISSAKSGPHLVCFVHFDLEMCLVPQRRAFFQHLNFQKWSERGAFVLYILAWKCAARHNGVQFFISPLASWLRTRRFSEPTFRPSGATNHWN